MSPSASAQFLPTSKTIHAISSYLRWRISALTRNSRPVRSSTEAYFQVSNAFSAACIAGSTSEAPAVWWTPTISDGLAGLREFNFSAVFTRRPPMTRSYSRPSSLRTVSMAARIRRACSGLLKSTDGSFLNCSGMLSAFKPSRVGASVVAIGVSSQKGGSPSRRRALRLRYSLMDVEVLLVQGRIAFYQHRFAGEVFHLGDQFTVICLQRFGNFRMDAHRDVSLVVQLRHLAHFDVELVVDRRDRLHKTCARAIRARFAKGALQRLLHPLARDRHQSEIVELEHLGRSAIVAQRLLQRLHHLLPVLAFVHVNEVDDDNPAQIAQPDLPHDFLDGIHVGLHNGVFQALGLANVLAGVDVNGHQRFGLVDDDGSAALQPHLRLQGAVDFVLNAELLEQRRVFRVQLDPPDHRRLESVGEAQDALVFIFGVHPDLREVGIDLVAQHPFHQIQVMIDQGWRFAVFGAVLDLGPQVLEKADVGAKVLFLDVRRGSAHDESTQAVFALAGDDALQAQAFVFRCNLSRDPDVVHRRHVDQEAAR